MALSALTVVPAGAGSGKTFRIKEDLGQWIVDGAVAPERIVAVTFTEAAAAELRDRIRRRLLELDRLEDALLLDQAYISTIHGFGLRIVTEFAFDSGQSPMPRLLSEDEQDVLIRQSLARTERAEAVLADLAAFGYSYDFNSGKSAAELFRDDVLGVVALLRSIGWQADNPCDISQAQDWIAKRYGALGDGKKVTKALRSCVDALLKAFPESMAGQYGAGNASATKDFRDNYRSLRLAQEPGELEQNWGLWQKLRCMRCSLRGAGLPEAYVSGAQAVVTAADALVTHPGPLAHAQEHIDALLGAGQEVLVHYAEAKRQAGLVDYTDMIALADQLLKDRPEVLQELVGRIDCLVVDEFQDTNPQQFSLLWQLKEAGVPTLIVGDLKQAIMGFQGADPRLLEALIDQNKKNASPLGKNWRSQPPLMDFINAVGPGLFGDGYGPLEPRGEESDLAPLEIIEFPARARKSQHAVRAAYVGERVEALLADNTQHIIDRRTKQVRPLQGRDIAILCLTHKTLEEYARVLRAQGLRVRLEEGGWFESRPVQLAWYAISYVANPSDKHAALYLAVTELGSCSLEQGVRQLVEEGQIADPALAKLDPLLEAHDGRTTYALVCDVIAALSLFDVVSHWPDAVQARANLLRLQFEAGEFINSNREAKACGGFYGDGLASFQAWLAIKVGGKDKNRQPAPRVQDEDAIELVTWHASKGREWPIVVVGELDRKVAPRLPSLDLSYQNFSDLAALLDKARIEYSPKFAAPESTEKFAAALQAAAETEARRLLYVAITRPREKLILEWPSFLEGKDSITPWSILTISAGMALEGSTLTIGAQPFLANHLLGDSELPAALNLESPAAVVNISRIGRRAIARNPLPEKVTPDSVSPSTLEALPRDGAAMEVLRYADSLAVDPKLRGTDFGVILHRYFEVVGANPGLIHRLIASTCGDHFPKSLAEAISQRVGQFEAWMHTYFKPTSIARELPILSLTDEQSVMSGIIDLVVENDKGCWIIDHKSDAIDDPMVAFAQYRVQLDAYADALRRQGRTVLGIGVNWIRRGEVVLESVG